MALLASVVVGGGSPTPPIPTPGLQSSLLAARGRMANDSMSPIRVPRGEPSAGVYELATEPSTRVYELVRVGAPQGPGASTPGSPSTWTYVPVLMYHYVRINPDPRDGVGFNLSVTPAMFHAQMDYLAQNGFSVLSLHQAVEAIRLHRALPSRPVVLTFDDGYADFYTTAVPELGAHGFTATDFVPTGLVGRSGYMTWPQIRSAEAQGFTMGAHTVNHVALAKLAPARAVWEMRQSKQTLETMLGHPILDFAYPYGSFNASVASSASRLGFECAATTMPGSRHGDATLMALSRVRIGGSTSLAAFAQLVGGPPPH